MKKNTIKVQNGRFYDCDLIDEYMDKDICEELNWTLWPCSNSKYYYAYCKAHEKKYNATFVFEDHCPEI